MKTRLAIRSRMVLVIIPVLSLLYILRPYRGWMTLLVGLGAAVLISLVWVLQLQKGLSFSHERRYSWVQVGDTIEERFSIRNASRLPALWIEVDYATSMPGYLPKRAVSVPGERTYTWTTRGVCSRRGIFELGPLTLRTGDPLGFFELIMDDAAISTVLVEPPVLPLPDFRIAPGGQSGESRFRGQSFDRSMSISNVREFVPGDAIRMIHWPTSARQGKYFVREAESRPAGDWWIFLDLDEKTQSGRGATSTVEHGVILAASIIEMGMRAGNAVGLVTQTGDLAWHPPHNGEAQRHAMMRTLALANPGPHSLRTILGQARPQFRHAPSLVIITANTSTAWLDGVLGRSRSGAAPTVLLLDPAGYTAPSGTGPSVTGMQAALSANGISHAVLQAVQFDRPEARPGKQGRWVWSAAHSSRAAALHRPTDSGWQDVRRGNR